MSKAKKFNHSNSKMLTRGGQITLNNLRMLVQVNTAIVKWALMLLIIICLASILIMTPFEAIRASAYYYFALALNSIWLGKYVLHYTYHGHVLQIAAHTLPLEQYFIKRKNIFIQDLYHGFIVGISICACFVLIVTTWLIRRGREQARRRFVRGSQIAKPEELAKAIKKYGASDIKISGVPMIRGFEVQHTLIHGTIGTGKSVTIMEMLDQIRARGDSAIVFDKGCTYTRNFYNQDSDTILNPFDQRCAGWDLWAECKTESDFQNIAESLIPMEAQSSDPYWTNAARTVFACTAYKLKNDEDRSLKKLIQLLLTAELEDLSTFLQGTAAATLVSNKIEKTAISIRSVLTTYLKCLSFMSEVDTDESFSIKEWLQDAARSNKHSRFCFISSLGEQHASLRPLISMWLSMASINLLSLEPNQHRRIWVIIDELPTLHKLPQLGETIAEVRKFGGCFVLGMQSLSQLQKIYGRDGSNEIFDLLNTRFYFRSPSSEMAKLVSNELGHQEIEQSNESYSYGSNTIRDGISIGTHTQRRELVSESEIMNLEALKCFLRVPADLPCALLTLRYRDRMNQASGFIEKKVNLFKQYQSSEETHTDDNSTPSSPDNKSSDTDDSQHSSEASKLTESLEHDMNAEKDSLNADKEISRIDAELTEKEFSIVQTKDSNTKGNFIR